MNHLDLLTYSIYADRELPPAEATAVREHLAACAECARLVEALEQENRVLRAGFTEEAVPASLRERVATSLAGKEAGLGPAMLYAAGILMGIFAGIYYLGTLLQSVSLFEPLAWFDPGASATWLDWLFRTFFFVYEEGWTMLLNAAERISAVAVGLLALRAVLPWLRRRWSGLLGTALAAFVLLMLVAASAAAVEFRHVHGVVKVAKGEVVNDTLVVAGQTVVVEGTVEGDLVAAGKRIEVRGEVKGDVIAAAENIVISGTVYNNAILAGSRLSLEGTVQRNVYVAGSNIELSVSANVHKAVFAAASEGTIDGKIGDSLTAAMGSLQMAGSVARNVRVRGGRLTLLSGAHIGGDLVARTRQPAHLDPGAKVDGKTATELIRAKPRFLRARFYLLQLIWLLGAFLVGIVLLKLFPRFFSGAADAVGSIWRSLGLGLAVLAGVPVALIIVGITLVGLPLALICLAIYLTALFLAKIFVAAFLGRQLLKTPAEVGYGSLGALLLGLAILTVIGVVPYLGFFVRVAVLVAGLGGLAWQVYTQAKLAAA